MNPRALLVLTMMVLAGISCGPQAVGGQGPVSPATDAEPPASVIRDESGRTDMTATAVAVPIPPDPEGRRYSIDTALVVDEDVEVMARMGGIVERIFVDRGSRVRKGEPLLRLMNKDLKLLVRRAEILARQRRADFERARELFSEDAISAAQFEQSDLAMQSAEVDVEIAREELERSIVRAPFDGVVIDRFARPGQKIIEDDAVPLFRVTTLSPLLARLYLPEEIARLLHEGDIVGITPRYVKAVSVEGTVSWLSSVVDASSGTCQAIVSVPGGGEDGALSPGTAVTLVLDLPDASPGVLIPRSALDGGSDDSGPRSARVRVLAEGHGSWRKVRLGRMHDDTVEILDGLRAGERVVLGAAREHEASESR